MIHTSLSVNYVNYYNINAIIYINCVNVTCYPANYELIIFNNYSQYQPFLTATVA